MDYSFFFMLQPEVLLRRIGRSAFTQKSFEDFQNQGPCVSPTSTYPKLRYPALRQSPLIVLHLAGFQLCCMMIKCAFTQKKFRKTYFQKIETVIRLYTN